jgi:hypothetical protein
VSPSSLHARARLDDHERMDITGLRGVTEAQREALLALGAMDKGCD